MDSFKETRQQIRIALIGLVITFTIGIVGFIILEKPAFEATSFFDLIVKASWLTTMTLTTVGYGDYYAQTDAGRIFTMLLVLLGFGIVAYGLQASATFLFSPAIAQMRKKKQTLKTISRLDNHYVICGNGTLVNKTLTYLLESVRQRLAFYDDEIYGPLDDFLDGIFGDDALGHYPRIRAVIRSAYLSMTRPFANIGTMLDLIVIVTEDANEAKSLREQGFLVIEGKMTRDEVLQDAGVTKARALMIMLDDDTETLLTVLTARNLNPDLYITAATREEDIANKILRVGANNVIRPYEIAGQFLNNVTLRPTVYDFFNGIFFDQTLDIHTTQINLQEGSSWIGKRIRDLDLRHKYNCYVLAIHKPNEEEFIISPSDTYILSKDEEVIIVGSRKDIPHVISIAKEGTSHIAQTIWQPPVRFCEPRKSNTIYNLDDVPHIVEQMEKHFIICGSDQVARNAIHQLDPERPFVIVTEKEDFAQELISRGFRVILGDPTHEDTLQKAGCERALAMMTSLHNEADTVLSVITARALSKHLLITATANDEANMHKIQLAGADRVINPDGIAAQFVLLSTTRPSVSRFFQYVLYNEEDEVETTELYMQDNSPWVGKKLADLRLERLFRAHVIGVRHANGSFEYAPNENYEIRYHEVLIVVTPMMYADELRLSAHGNATKRPDTLRRPSVITTTIRRNPLLD